MKWFAHLKDSWKVQPKDNKVKWIVILFLIGSLLLFFPTSEKKQASSESDWNKINQTNPTQKELEKLLSDFTGHKVKVLISYADSGEVEVISEESTDAEASPESSRLQTDRKPVLDNDKNIMIKKRYQPDIKGVCIFYFGAYDTSVEAALCRSAAGALGAELHTVEVVFQPKS